MLNRFLRLVGLRLNRLREVDDFARVNLAVLFRFLRPSPNGIGERDCAREYGEAELYPFEDVIDLQGR